MEIVKGKPPHEIAERCAHYFDLTGVKPVYTYGNKIYCPLGSQPDEALVAHETVHMIQQGDEPEKWWVKYFADKDFRFEQELQAYRVQYKTFKQIVKNRDDLARILVSIASDLSSPMYGDLCTLQEAIGLIRE